jgi:hypothetical protein
MNSQILNDENKFCDNLAKRFADLAITVTYFNINEFAISDIASSQLTKSITFILKFHDLPPKPLESFKYSIKATIPVYSDAKHWLDIKTDALQSEMTFSCHFDIADLVIKNAGDVISQSYSNAIA